LKRDVSYNLPGNMGVRILDKLMPTSLSIVYKP